MRVILKERSAAQQPCIVATTATALKDDRELCLAAGMNDYIAKPIRIEELIGALSKTIPVGSKQNA